MVKLFSLSAVALTLSLASVAEASSITINTIQANWNNAQLIDGTAPTFRNLDGIAGNEQIRWGGAASVSSQSGYNFTSASTPTTVAADTSFSLGAFTHFNFPIAPPSLAHATLNVGMNFTLDNGTSLNRVFSFGFSHNETTNNFGDARDNDLVTVGNLITSDVFKIDSTTYSLSALGFLQNGQIVHTFSTTEGLTNTAQLMGVFTAVTDARVPEPSSLLLIGLGLLGLVGVRKFK